MKKFILLLLVPVIIAGCTNADTQTNTSLPDTKSAMDNMPCHTMPDGTLMGDCEEQDHEHVDGVADDHDEEKTEDHDDTGLPPHRH